MRDRESIHTSYLRAVRDFDRLDASLTQRGPDDLDQMKYLRHRIRALELELDAIDNEELARAEASTEMRPPYTSVRHADEMPEADFYGEG